MLCSFAVKAHIKIFKVWRKDQFEVSNPYFELDLFCYLVVDLFITCQPLSSNLLNTLEYSLGNFWLTFFMMSTKLGIKFAHCKVLRFVIILTS